MVQNLKETQLTMDNVLLSIDKLTKLLPENLQQEEAIEFSETLKKSPISTPSFTYSHTPESNLSLKSITNMIQRVSDKKAVWIDDILPKMSTMRHTGKVKELTRRGIDKDIRGLVWQTALDNQLNIEPSLYQSFLEKWGDKIETNISLIDSPPSTNSSTSSSLNSSSIISSSLPSNATQSPPPSPPNGFNTTEEAILYSFSMIDIDLPRTFASFSLLNHESSQFRKQLQRILKGYVNLSPTLGYVQGMSYLAAMLLLHMDEYQSFVCFCNLLNNRFLQSLYQLKMKEVDNYMNAFEMMLQFNMPKLAEHFKELQMLPHHYLIQWWMTVFCQSLPLPVCIRVWDCFIIEGNLFLFVTALGILFHYKKQLEEGSLEFCKNFLANLPNDLDADSLFRSIDNINISYCSQIYKEIERVLADDMELQSIEQEPNNFNSNSTNNNSNYHSFDLRHTTNSPNNQSPEVLSSYDYEEEEEYSQHSDNINDQLRFSANSIVNLSPRNH
ncbi:RabGAP/TBC domain-containing protein [Heterostelium album PN500]|uniref:RabGAP/TBC domain-containing protein n=1 Tax=Heterostelium pallidum (strain ATCC 26659 / Pp 5 / PN500) TaxID=670386 RepID=D3AXJ7_HETP5|nr:RabGAP/TBC domain-containing protein [Heterostelium album PN500]EFA86266.1 RabGAP/TBC domain-containing protein [Heterostelium album PN500]|eukprot:XP_020438371.1 RabGAP/TBC domain-containing protein [Heterostelium album PN500]